MIVRRVTMAMVMALVLSAGAEASPLCERLFARLADLPVDLTESAPAESRPRDYSGAISRQNIELRRARSEQRALGCSRGSIVVVNGDNEEACAGLDARIVALDDELDLLKARRTEELNGSQDDAARRRVLVALQANGCEDIDREIVSASVSPDDEAPRRHRNIIADLPPIGSEADGLRGPADLPVPDLHDLSRDLNVLSQDGPLRTMCVRTCDGSFFPISSNATSRDFSRDAAACSARCPGAETELFYHPLTAETDSMVSTATGRPYTDLPTAFAYKTGSAETRSQCGCRLPLPAAGLSPARGAPMSTPASKPGTSVVTITTTPTPASATPASPAQKTYLPSVAPVVAPDRPIEERPYDPKANRVRQVGPAFLPAEESAIDLRHPKGPDYQPLQAN